MCIREYQSASVRAYLLPTYLYIYGQTYMPTYISQTYAGRMNGPCLARTVTVFGSHLGVCV